MSTQVYKFEEHDRGLSVTRYCGRNSHGISDPVRIQISVGPLTHAMNNISMNRENWVKLRNAVDEAFAEFPVKPVITSFEYRPSEGRKAGIFRFMADTPIGKFVWSETIPCEHSWFLQRGRDQHPESVHLLVTLNGVDLLLESGPDFTIKLDFEPPRKKGKWSELFSKDMVENEFIQWFNANYDKLLQIVS